MLALGQHHSKVNESTINGARRLQSSKTILRQISVQESAFQFRKEESSETQLLLTPDFGNSKKDIFSVLSLNKNLAIDSHFLRQVSVMRTRAGKPENFIFPTKAKKCFLLSIKHHWDKETCFFPLLCCFQVLRNKTKTPVGTWLAGMSGPGLTLTKHVWLCIA